ncbi:hypothetical protein ACOSQ2_028064 [Xanthoceras sorbifolium]
MQTQGDIGRNVNNIDKNDNYVQNQDDGAAVFSGDKAGLSKQKMVAVKSNFVDSLNVVVVVVGGIGEVYETYKKSKADGKRKINPNKAGGGKGSRFEVISDGLEEKNVPGINKYLKTTRVILLIRVSWILRTPPSN